MSTPNWVVISVKPKTDYSMLVYFADGTKKIFDAKPLLSKKNYEPLNNINLFMNAKAEYGTVIWRDDIDIAPEYLYEQSIAV